MIPCMVKETHDADPRYRAIRFVYTIHNMAYQGNFGPEMLDSCLGLPYYLLDNGNVRFDGGISNLVFYMQIKLQLYHQLMLKKFYHLNMVNT